ncbi:MAG TPA: hypothetical protein VGM56_20325 [Byssovorax sp.]
MTSDSPARVLRLRSRAPGSALEALSSALGVVEAAFDSAACDAWARAILAARDAWTADFDGAQFSLGRAFYTHLEERRLAAYFDRAPESDALVERVAPGLQAQMLGLIARFTGARVRPRRGFCGPGVHVFPAGGEVATRGGAVHFDTEGLPREHIARRRRALSVVAMLLPAERGGGLRLWPAVYVGRDAPSAAERGPPATVRYRVGDAVGFDSYRLHQIRPFTGHRPRVSATVHAAEVDDGLWETWF